ncbi:MULTISPECIES: YggT family protein [Nocardiaceae]|uniref:YggT family protein n=1 Tax=Nocardiaceae TaxID=85025 RepID=UPI000364DE04|nr:MULTISPECIES: YggT family protein [Rhodococcus]OZC47700.1 YggT family protein [Rhodococcus sp. RS1C4]OZC61451.1 YggT family protein [Rhodococcus sp. 06-621-2]OZC81027.1 YggT family protein [Rhodococcus sp. 06-418-1B]OZD13235.1 YggT family protein [Rhodococcus sp. 06-156-4C]OZD16169.1 YggT family protein [Rhodococcus sp. 06-156-3C]
MALFAVIYFILFIFWLLLIGRIIVEFIRTFARDWRPSGIVVVLLEAIFTVTDPPVKLLRRVIPPVNLGGVRLDLSIMVLLFGVFILMSVVRSLGS